MSEYLQVALLAVIQGAAELLPVSSSAHVILAQKLMGRDPSSPANVFLLVMLHTGTMFAVLYYFWPRWKTSLFRSWGSQTTWNVDFLKWIVVATFFTGVLGLGLKFLIENVIMVRLLHHEKGEIEKMFKDLWLVGSALLAVGLVILAAALWENRAERKEVSRKDSILIGLMQGLCLPFRGFSRSGATISVGLFTGLSRRLSEDFSFALAVVLTPPVLAYSLYRLLKEETWPGRTELLHLLGPGLVGMVFSFLAGLIALRILSAALEHGKWKYFGYYCIVAALVVFGSAYAGV
jgi:undecaprenyl-diphosphatase